MERRFGGISRRDSLKLAGAFLAGGVFGSCDRQRGGRNNTVFSPAAATQEVQPGWEQDAIFNAASFQLQLNILNGASRIVSGHGSLFKDSNGRLDLKSVGHIVLPEGISQRNTSLSVLPPTGSNRFLIEAGRIAGDFSDPDGIVDISLPDDLNEMTAWQLLDVKIDYDNKIQSLKDERQEVIDLYNIKRGRVKTGSTVVESWNWAIELVNEQLGL